jgi:hypothetical protein
MAVKIHLESFRMEKEQRARDVVPFTALFTIDARGSAILRIGL